MARGAISRRPLIGRGAAAVVAAVLAAVLGGAAAAQPDDTIRAIEATYLYKFGPFIEWPDLAFESPDEPVRLCVVGEDPFGPMLDRAVTGQQIRQRPIEIRRMASVGRTTDCHILYAAGSDAQPVPAILAALRGRPVLTVTSNASAAPGVVNFLVEDDRVRFEIDEELAAQNGLAISSKVLSLALRVRPRRN